MEPSSPRPENKRKHVTTACVACRASKVKCNGVTPTCSSCLARGKECRYESREDKRKLSHRVAIELLADRVQHLTHVLEKHGLPVPPMAPGEEKILSETLRALQIARIQPLAKQHGTEKSDSDSGAVEGSRAAPTPNQDQRSEPATRTRTAQALVQNPSGVPPSENAQRPPSPTRVIRGSLELANAAGDTGMGGGGMLPDSAGWEWNVPSESVPPPPPPQENMVSAGYVANGASLSGFGEIVPTTPSLHTSASDDTPPSRPSMDWDSSIHASEGVDELVDQLSDRVGTLHIRPGGHIRFYGSTSNFNLLETPAADVSMNVHRTIRHDGPEHLDRLGLAKDVPPEVEDHLKELYFAWQDPSFHVVDRKVYEEAKVMWCDRMEDTSYYSEALRNAICALGAAFEARHHPTFVTFPRSLADFFADRAKALLEIELDSPCVATIQTLILLSAHDIGCGRDARGWLFSGMAMRLSFNLALHHDLRPYVAKGVVTAAEADLRRTVFWAAFVVDHVWSFYLGQPFRVTLKGVTLDKPGGARSHQETRDSYHNAPSASSPQSYPPPTQHIEDVCRYQVLLFEVMAPLSDTLYGSETISKSLLQELNQQTVDKLLDWKKSLPAELQVDLGNREATYMPHVILLHMQYYQSIIYAHRPWMSKRHIQPQPPQGPGAGHARMACMDAARSIAQLLRLYEARYTLRRINIQAVAITFSAALLLVFGTVSRYQPEREEEILADLSACFRALDELAPSWDTAKRARDFLIRLQRHWERQARAGLLTSERGETGSTRAPGVSNGKKRPWTLVRSSDESPPVRVRAAEPALSLSSSSLDGGYWGEAGGSSSTASIDYGADLDFDWMLTTSMEGMPGNWGNVFSV